MLRRAVQFCAAPPGDIETQVSAAAPPRVAGLFDNSISLRESLPRLMGSPGFPKIPYFEK